MKALKTLFAASLLLGLGFTSCNKDDDSVSPDAPVHLPAESPENPIGVVPEPMN
ncbi:hypothetical protein [Saccharicrinis aurantiacus]|uniref:hypothetical protein n=1 Tax=Saccharicrinis aurantiacus TaxID=1849719 RepID=UPI0024927722|nr:hypothetical protein [Saccharicrinis aurantiacus]